MELVDAGDRKAGSIRLIHRATKDKERSIYRMHVNRNHSLPVQFATLTHELGHLFLGHLGADKLLNIPQRSQSNHVQKELEAESVAYLVCARNGVKSKSQTYLSNYVNQNPMTKRATYYGGESAIRSAQASDIRRDRNQTAFVFVRFRTSLDLGMCCAQTFSQLENLKKLFPPTLQNAQLKASQRLA